MLDNLLRKYINELPVGNVVDKVNNALEKHSTIVVTAPPGAGKSTLLPLTVYNNIADSGKKILILEPRRIAAKQIAERMSDMIGQNTGELVGYKVRFEKKVSKNTRIEVVTEGVLTRMIAADPFMEDVSIIIFDEFHERNINTDVALALALETQNIIRHDLRIIIMSATIDATSLCEKLQTPLIESKGRMFDVETVYCGDIDIEDCATAVTRITHRAYSETDGNILVFLPGQSEINRCLDMLTQALPPEVMIRPLYGQLPPQAQKEAIAPPPDGRRKIVLATSIAETSLTIEGITVVVDSGYCRRAIYDPHNGVNHLTTQRISMDMARQRSGRAGRTEPGICYRLWSKATEAKMAECRKPEVLEADLTSVILNIAVWGGSNITNIKWLTPPPKGHVEEAIERLQLLGALNNSLCVTSFGTSLASLPCHPRIAAMLVKANSPLLKALAADIAAILEEKDPMSQSNDADINTRILLLRDARKTGNLRGWKRIARTAQQYRQMVRVTEDNTSSLVADTGKLIASAYPDRIAIHEDKNTYRLACGQNVTLDANDDLHSCRILAVASFDKKIFLASPLTEEDAKKWATTKERIVWDSAQGRISGLKELRIGNIILQSKPLDCVPKEKAMAMAIEIVKKEGVSLLSFDKKFETLLRRLAIVAKWHPELEIPTMSQEQMLENANEWLPMYVNTPITANELKKVNLSAVVWNALTYEQQQTVERIAPTLLTMPTGSRIRLDYREGTDIPVLSVRLQECFGMTDTPRINEGQTPILMELLSPGFKPVQLTSDLNSFWNNAYFEVRKEMKRRYPKHYWPDNPLEAEATRGIKRK